MQGGPRIRQLDDLSWMEVAKFRLADGRIAAIREKWIELSPRFVCFYNQWDPGALTPPHGHTGDHAVFVVKGEITCGDITCGPGSHIMLEWGDTLGPWRAGPQGCELYGFIAGDGRPFFDHARWQAFLAQEGAEELPVPMPPLPLWQASAGAGILPGPVDSA